MPFKPPKAAGKAAEVGLEQRREFGRGGTPVGVARARDLAAGKNMPDSTIKRMHSFFQRHEVDKKGKGFYPGDEGYPSAGRIAWNLWGGEPGRKFARGARNKILARLKRAKG